MIALDILDVKSFMKQLLVEKTFDSFLLSEATVTTFNQFYIDGALHPDFFDTDTKEQLKNRKYSYWKELREFVFSIIKGKRTPLHFKMVFQLPHTQIVSFLQFSNLEYEETEIQGLFFNLLFDGHKLTCTTGTSQKHFTMDRTIDNAWDLYVMSYFKNNGISTEKL
ncbi:MAG: DUF5721 family protein [Lachnospiraceae bacterium]|nr:DUF5721 family protein [Lachnospiraceae bacterium]MDD3617757.1 DUF5721 family protein [Lachnospiraceae bacterium]